MSVWIELHCDSLKTRHCYSNRNDNPVALSHNGQGSVKSVLKILHGLAKERGWKKTKTGWYCPACWKLLNEGG